MARTGFGQIDGLLEDRGAATLAADNATPETVGFIQDLLIGQNFSGIPGPLGPARGRFGPRTTESIREFQDKRRLPVTGTVDVASLRALIEPGWPRPIACCGYVALVLDMAFVDMVRLVSITSQFEGAGRFAALNLNTDRAGLSFGLIQWAQKPGRLNELLRAFESREPALFAEVFGGGDANLTRELIAHTSGTRGGTDANGATTNSRFDLVRDPWVQRFTEAGRDLRLQRVQLDLAVADFGKSFANLQTFAPEIRSERGIAFMLDLANQHGDGGAQSIVRQVHRPEMTESELLVAAENESVARVRAQFGEGDEAQSTLARRQAFRTTALLSDQAVSV